MGKHIVSIIQNLNSQTHVLDVESESLVEEAGQFYEQHVPAEVVQEVRDHNGPERDRGEDLQPRHRRGGTLFRK